MQCLPFIRGFGFMRFRTIINILKIVRFMMCNQIVSEALFYTRRDTLFQDPFLGCVRLSDLVSRLLFFSCFLYGFLIAGVRKTQEDTLKVFIYQNTRHAKQQTQGE